MPIVNAALKSVALLKADKGLRQRLLRNTDYVKTTLREAGFVLPDAPGPVVSLFPTRESEISRLKRALLRAGIYPPFLKYPGAPASGYFRFAISSEHSRAQLDGLVGVLTEALKR